MNFGRRVPFLVALAVLVAAALVGTIDRSAAGAGPKGGGLIPFRSCDDLLGYAKSQAARFVGPWGLGRPETFGGIPVPVAGQAPTRDTSPQQGVDYSGTNVQEEGVDEPDLVK